MSSASHLLEASLPGEQGDKTPLPQQPSWLVTNDPINCGGSGAGMEFMAFPAWELSVGEDGSDLETFSQEKKRKEIHAGLTFPPAAGKGLGAIVCMCMF